MAMRADRVTEPVEGLEIPMDFEVVLHGLLGLEHMLCAHNGSSLNAWRRCLRTYFESLDKVIRDTLQGDTAHKARLRQLCKRGAENARRARSHSQALTESVGTLARLSFDLLGGARRGSRGDWCTARYRTVAYTVSTAQKAARIKDQVRYRWTGPEELPELVALMGKHVELGDDAFVEWFRAKFPKSYAEMF